ncbi:MAG: class I SAM-dependent methyltransferase [Eubacteriales bacterium]|nr:class I SAM-dependent methyltransferase [Eubacteriales bacterium]MDD3866183.1 class I SAM-dependent methyltransferase [Eubacteriales bacterium]MDD4462200.1 class I SAM-dependent methyltransferase [Eubacteriales bacterium]
MNIDQLRQQWESEENQTFRGWDFSCLDGRWHSEALPWDYRALIQSKLNQTDRLLDMGTGGGEFLLSLKHPCHLTAVTEAYPPNIDMCQTTLAPLGIDVQPTSDDQPLPFPDDSFDCVINRHESYDPEEVRRVLKNDGYFITQQVGGLNNRDLSRRVIKDFEPEFPAFMLKNETAALRAAGFEILFEQEAFPPVQFFDVGAFVYFAKIIEWEFPGFSVEKAWNELLVMQQEIERHGKIQGTEHRFVIMARNRKSQA